MAAFQSTIYKFLWFMFFMNLSLVYFTLFGMIVALTPTQDIAALFCYLIFILWNIFSGFIIPRMMILVWWRLLGQLCCVDSLWSYVYSVGGPRRPDPSSWASRSDCKTISLKITFPLIVALHLGISISKGNNEAWMFFGIAEFMEQVLQGLVSFSPSQMIITAGAASAIETLCFCVADPGHAILVPSPYDTEYDRILKWRTGVDVIPVPCRSTDNFNLSIIALERAYTHAKKRGVKVRAVLISNPSNPTGNLLKREAFYDLLEFIQEKNIHLICDELLLGSVRGEKTCMSVAEIIDTEDLDKSRVHIIYRLSEDLSLPDIHVGVIYSLNDTILSAAAKFARFSPISILTQRVLILMLSDKQFISDFLLKTQARLVNMHHAFVQGLKKLDIDCANGSSVGFRCWVDLSKFLRSYSEKGELEMWEKLLYVAKLNTTPGSLCHCIEPGWFHFCLTNLSESDIDVVVRRIMGVITMGHKVDH